MKRLLWVGVAEWVQRLPHVAQSAGGVLIGTPAWRLSCVGGFGMHRFGYGSVAPRAVLDGEAGVSGGLVGRAMGDPVAVGCSGKSGSGDGGRKENGLARGWFHVKHSGAVDRRI